MSIPKIALLANDLASAHSVRQAIRRAGLTVTLVRISTREEFLTRIRHDSMDVILLTTHGPEGLKNSEILEESRRREKSIPVVLIGGEAEERNALEKWRGGTLDFLSFSQFEQLPAVLERVLRKQRDRKVTAHVQGELDRCADVLRENQKLITLGRLTASISHEINNPLESITNLLYLMEVDRESPEKWEEYLHLAQRELGRVVQISKQTLSFSRETSAPTRVQLADLAEEVLTLYGRRISEKRVHVTREYESNEPISVFPGEMRQVLSNLIANAVEATGAEGSLVIRIRPARKWSDEGVHGVRLSVADNGTGMTAEVRNRLGEPFFTTKGHHGTGLGLWVTRSILNRYGGNLQLRSSVTSDRHGTVFSMFLPTNMRPQAVVPQGNRFSSSSQSSTSQENSQIHSLDETDYVGGTSNQRASRA